MGKQRETFPGEYTKPYQNVLKVLPDKETSALTKQDIAGKILDEPDINAGIVGIRIKRLKQWQEGGYKVISIRPNKGFARYYKVWIGQGEPLFPIPSPNQPKEVVEQEPISPLDAKFKSFVKYLKQQDEQQNLPVQDAYNQVKDIAISRFTCSILSYIAEGRLNGMSDNLFEYLSIYTLTPTNELSPEDKNLLELKVLKAVCLSLRDSWIEVNLDTDWQKITAVVLRSYRAQGQKLIRIFAEIFTHFKADRLFPD